MTVQELISLLSAFPDDCEVSTLESNDEYDLTLSTPVDVWGHHGIGKVIIEINPD